MPAKIPLPVDYFRCPPLSQEAIQRYADLGRHSAETLIQKAKLRDGAIDWKMHKDESELKIYKEESCTEIEGPPRYCGVMQVVGELDEYIDLFRYDTTDQARESFRRFGGTFVDAAVLYTVQSRHPDRPNDATHIKWCLAKSPMERLAQRRDFVIIETDREFKVDGKRAWVRSHRSIELAAVPDMRKVLNCVRGEMNDMGYVVVESDRPGYLHMTYVADMAVHGFAQLLAIDSTLKSWLRTMTSIDRCMRENRLSRTPFLDSTQLALLEGRSTCSLCRQKFGSRRKKANCFKCGEVVCRGCNPLWNVRMDGHDAQVRACLPCSLNTSDFSSWTHNSSLSTMATPAWPAMFSKISEWSMLESKDDGTVDDDDVLSVASVDLSTFDDLEREYQVHPIVLDIPSMRG
ncbi:hypothetical protein LEN26_008164 [Aphanomyces euteiches]|nr:hypothetical protein AeMF1_018096 [Aphanomyces euteiches]KAH9130819.1 hypothetical protein LEN26_008164 [Aphanomyces euteiches]